MIFHLFLVLPIFANESNISFIDKPILLVADNWCPQHCESDAKNKGYIVDIVSEALSEEKAPFKIVYAPWMRALRNVEDGVFDGLLTPTLSYKNFLFHKEAVGYQQYCFYVNKDSEWRYTKMSDLLGKRIAHLKESGFGELDSYFKDNQKSIEVKEFVGDKDFTTKVFKFLSLDRADAIIITSDVYQYALKNKNITDSFITAGCLTNEKLSVGLSKHDKKRSSLIAETIDRGIIKLRKSGRLEEILKNYGITPWF